MADYREMYRKLFQATTNAIDILQKAQQETEEPYMTSDQPELHFMKEEEPSQKDSAKIVLDGQAAPFPLGRPFAKK